MTLAIINQDRTNILATMMESMREQNEDKFMESIQSLAHNIENEVLEKAKELTQTNDVQVLAARGVRQLTSKEKTYYEKVIEAMKSKTPEQSLENLDVVMPETVIDSVFQDLETSHPLLSKIHYENTHGLVKFLMNTNGFMKAVWGKLTEPIKEELSSGFKEVNMVQMKLTAFIPVSHDMLDLGPQWLDNYIRKILYEALANGLEFGIVNNLDTATGPIAMIADLSKGTVTGDSVTYKTKTTTPIADLSPVTLGVLLAKLAQTEKGNPRVIQDVILVVNPIDYFNKIFPATTVMGADGTYRNDVLPYPITVIQSAAVPQNKAVLGLGYRYFMGVGANSKDGKIVYSDEYKFLEDERVYAIKMYANGMPMDNNAFAYLDITDLKPAIIKVETITNVPNTPAA